MEWRKVPRNSKLYETPEDLAYHINRVLAAERFLAIVREMPSSFQPIRLKASLEDLLSVLDKSELENAVEIISLSLQIGNDGLREATEILRVIKSLHHEEPLDDRIKF